MSSLILTPRGWCAALCWAQYSRGPPETQGLQDTCGHTVVGARKSHGPPSAGGMTRRSRTVPQSERRWPENQELDGRGPEMDVPAQACPRFVVFGPSMDWGSPSQWTGPSALLSPPTRMLPPAGNSLTETPQNSALPALRCPSQTDTRLATAGPHGIQVCAHSTKNKLLGKQRLSSKRTFNQVGKVRPLLVSWTKCPGSPP